MTDCRNINSDPNEASDLPSQVNADGVPVGEQIRDLRKAKGMTITELAIAIDRSVGYVSQVERNISPVPIDRIKEFAEALGVQITWFFQGGTTGPEDERDFIVRRGDRRKLTFTGSGVTEELLSPNLGGGFEMIMTTYAPLAKTGDANYTRPCEEAAYVIEGRLEIWIGERHFMLETGDSITFDGNDPHSSANPDNTPAIVMWVMSPPTY